MSTHDKNTYSTLSKYGKRDTCNTLATYDTKNTHITLDTYDTKNTFNIMSTHDKKTLTSHQTQIAKGTCATHWAHMKQREHTSHWTQTTRAIHYCMVLHVIACYCMVLHGITWYLEFAAYDSSPSYIEQQHASLFFISFVYIIQFLCFCCPNVLFQCSLCVLYVICK